MVINLSSEYPVVRARMKNRMARILFIMPPCNGRAETQQSEVDVEHLGVISFPTSLSTKSNTIGLGKVCPSGLPDAFTGVVRCAHRPRGGRPR